MSNLRCWTNRGQLERPADGHGHRGPQHHERQQPQLLAAGDQPGRPACRAGRKFVIGQGVTVESVTQIRSQFIEAQMPSAFGSSSSAASAASTLTAPLHPLDPSATGGLASQLGNYYAALQALAQNPGDPSLRQAAVSAAQALTTAFNQTSQSITGAQNGVDSQLPSLASQVNSLTSQMAALNAQIRMDEASGGTPNDLLDQRQSIQDQIEQLTGAVPIPTAVTSKRGAARWDLAGQWRYLFDHEHPGRPAPRHLDILLTPPGGTALTIPTLRPRRHHRRPGWRPRRSPRYGALLARQHGLRPWQCLERRPGSRLRQQRQPGQNFFTVGGIALVPAGTISVNRRHRRQSCPLAAASTAAGGTGDATNLQSLIATQGTNLATSGCTPRDPRQPDRQLWRQTQQAQNAQTQSGAILQNLQQMRSSVSGVSIDAESTTIDQPNCSGRQQGHHRHGYAGVADGHHLNRGPACESATRWSTARPPTTGQHRGAGPDRLRDLVDVVIQVVHPWDTRLLPASPVVYQAQSASFGALANATQAASTSSRPPMPRSTRSAAPSRRP